MSQDKLGVGEPCSHPGCLSHVTHTCEGCGCIAGTLVVTQWKPIATAPKDNKRMLYLARFEDDELRELDFDGIWQHDSESYEIPEVYYFWASANGIEEPTHWAYQDEALPMTPIDASNTNMGSNDFTIEYFLPNSSNASAMATSSTDECTKWHAIELERHQEVNIVHSGEHIDGVYYLTNTELDGEGRITRKQLIRADLVKG